MCFITRLILLYSINLLIASYDRVCGREGTVQLHRGEAVLEIPVSLPPVFFL